MRYAKASIRLLVCSALAASTACARSPSSSTLHDDGEVNNEGLVSTDLKATDGTTIQVSAEITYEQESGIHVERDANQVTVRVVNSQLGANAAVRAVVIDLCTDAEEPNDPFPAEVQCDLTYTNGAYVAQVSPSCNLEGNPATLTLYQSTAGGTSTTCTQQIAVVANGVWLTDPINGSHNFNFSLGH